MGPSRWVLTAIATVMCFGLLSCSGDDDQRAGGTETIDLREPTIESSNEEDGGEDVAPQDTTPAEPVTIITEPAQRVVENPTIDASNWIARTAMSASFVELVWSPVEGADEYTLYRLPTDEADFDAIVAGVIDGADRIYEGPEFGFIDDDVPSSEFLTYVLVADVDGERTEPRWADALTVDDVNPPAPITGLTATETPDGVLLEWEPSPDDVEFAAYNVSILQDDGQLRFIGGGADVGQVSFLDDEAFTGTRTYVVAAVDFHNNVSEPGQVDVTR